MPHTIARAQAARFLFQRRISASRCVDRGVAPRLYLKFELDLALDRGADAGFADAEDVDDEDVDDDDRDFEGGSAEGDDDKAWCCFIGNACCRISPL